MRFSERHQQVTDRPIFPTNCLSQKVIDFLPEVKHRVGASTNPKDFESWKIPMFPFHEFMAMNAISQAGLKVEKSF